MPTIPKPTQSGTSKPSAPGKRGIVTGTPFSIACVMIGFFRKLHIHLDAFDYIERSCWMCIRHFLPYRSKASRNVDNIAKLPGLLLPAGSESGTAEHSMTARRFPPPWTVEDIGSQRTRFHYRFLGNLCPFAAKALPKVVSDPPPAGLTWHRPQANFVCAA